VVRPERLELPTLCSEGRCSIQLSYGLGTSQGRGFSAAPNTTTIGRQRVKKPH
jgi:hypothetical protein